MNIIILFSGLSFTILFLFIYIFLSEKKTDKKFQRIGMALEEINEELYQIEKKQKKLSNELKVELENLTDEKINNILNNIIQLIKESQQKSEIEIQSLYSKIEKLENNIKINSLPKFEIDNEKNEKTKIKELYEIGYSIEEIAKELNIPIGNVKLYLQF
jgi:DNA-binding NarL/FixJ family response regulator